MRIQIAGVHKYQILTSLAIKINSKWPTKCARTFSRSDYFYCFFLSVLFCLFAFPATQRKFTSQSVSCENWEGAAH